VQSHTDVVGFIPRSEVANEKVDSAGDVSLQFNSITFPLQHPLNSFDESDDQHKEVIGLEACSE
jgi:hypothetical protein